ncbi:hypothetical protein SERLA73DRAFT_112997 [Serpula lacrymans var. lacrymans S7.3]|uniref:B30.2/SPRY domain-containing protein n=2 Tax=Serpula lacrymans var. lacrymans TaxID=341189 RepID=F8Q7C1_SERL3|nr:uncharacterized protein SERLADRAFT_441373 [Serpula lacrymans var. lacrymans S7.9]EGN95459.1 hypothetical protein SERLA73DRAFT_112997 [Serpula lacrymans var. lacrymans S7.3]EGO20987.1 hypothetical protein SERLADRAFT_441373 [Serpula lacrymans var. lacrymans S7.9]
MLATAASSPALDESRPSTPAAYTNPAQFPNKKRKHAAVAASNVPEASPAPQDPPTPAESVVLPARHDLFSRPRLSISRFPSFPTTDNTTYHTTDQLAMNKLNFRYVPAGVAPPGSALACRTIESAPASFRVSWEDRSPFVKVTPDGLGLLGDKGYRSARCNAPVREGRWYMEVRIQQGGGESSSDMTSREGSYVRLGWARREAPLNGPAGLDGYSYGYRDKTGEKVTASRPRPYGQPFSSGDVVGMYIALPPRRKPDPRDPHDPAKIKRERIAIEFKGQEYFESLEYPQSKEMMSLVDYSNKPTKTSTPSSTKKSATVKSLPERGRATTAPSEPETLRPLPILPGSQIVFFVNGVCQDTAFEDIYDYIPLRTTQASRNKGKEKKRSREGAREHKENPFDDGTLGYYPFISLFNGAQVRINPGPDFDFTPPPNVDPLLDAETEEVEIDPTEERTWRPICERYPEFMAEQWAIDAIEEEEAKVEAAQIAVVDKVEADKRVQREKKRLQSNARKRAKKAVDEAMHTPVELSAAPTAVVVDDRLVPPVVAPGGIRDMGSPPQISVSATTFGRSIEMSHSPAPTPASSADVYGAQSGYDSENAGAPVEGDEVMEDPIAYKSPHIHDSVKSETDTYREDLELRARVD